jgi:hypothetical protein
VKVIYKYQLDVGTTVVKTDPSAVVLSVGSQNKNICAWVLLDIERDQSKDVEKEFHVFGTGWNFELGADDYYGTVQIGVLVWHVFGELFNFHD